MNNADAVRSHPLTQRALAAIDGHIPELRNCALVVAVSGGPDSTALLRVLATLQAERELTLVVAHANHGLRGPDADADAAFVRELARRFNLPCEITRLTLNNLRGNLPQIARLERMAFFRDVGRRHATDWVALGHQRDDVVETVLLRLARGSGPAGLAGLRPFRRAAGLRLARPLLDVSRAEILAFLRDIGQEWRDDDSNRSARFRRNALRARAIPLLREILGASFDQNAATAARCAASDAALLIELVDATLERMATWQDGCLVFRYNEFMTLSRPLRRRVLLRALEQTASLPTPCRERELQTVLGAMAAAAAQQDWQLRRRPVIHKRYDRLIIGSIKAATTPYEMPLTMPGVTQLPSGVLSATIEPNTVSRPSSANPCEALFDLHQLKLPLCARTRRPGDRIQIAAGIRKKVKDLMQESRVPKEQRGLIPLLADAEHLLWVAGLRRSCRALVTPSTHMILRLRWFPASALEANGNRTFS